VKIVAYCTLVKLQRTWLPLVAYFAFVLNSTPSQVFVWTWIIRVSLWFSSCSYSGRETFKI